MGHRCSTLAASLAVSASLAACAWHAPAPMAEAASGPEARIVMALETGLQAEAARDGAAMLTAAARLDSIGARPADGETDLAARWRAMARDLGHTAPPVRGRIAGPAYRIGSVGPGEAAVLRDSFHSGRAARVSLQTRSAGVLRLSVQRTDGESVCGVLAAEAPGNCQWIPVWSEPFTIEIAHLTGGPVEYYLITN